MSFCRFAKQKEIRQEFSRKESHYPDLLLAV